MKKNKEKASMDVIYDGKAHGSVADRLMKANFNIQSLRNNDTLLYDEWRFIDRVVMKAFLKRLTLVSLLERFGLTMDIGNGLAKTVLQYQYAGEVAAASMTMDAITRADRDRPEYDTAYLPLPIIHKDFSFSIREIQEARNGNMPLDTTMMEHAAQKVAEYLEELCLTGDWTYGGGTIKGLENFGDVNTGAISDWSNLSAVSGSTIKDNVLTMKQGLIDDRCYGPYVLLIPSAWEVSLDDDYVSGYPKTIRSRLLEISGIVDVVVNDYMTSTYAILLQLDTNTIRLIKGMPITTVQWDTEGGLQKNFKVMTIQVPQIRSDANSRCGIYVGT